MVNDDGAQQGLDTDPQRSPFHSILFDGHDVRSDADDQNFPAFWVDLNLDQVVDAITTGKDEYQLRPSFNTRLTAIDSIAYRHEVFRDLDGAPLFEHISSFAQSMQSMRSELAQVVKLRYLHQKQWWFLRAIGTYCDAVTRLSEDLNGSALTSRGFVAFRAYLTTYVTSDAFTSLLTDTRQVVDDLSAVLYTVRINGTRVQVGAYQSEQDYSAEVEATFERFKRGAVKDYRVAHRSPRDMNHVEARVLDMVADINPDAFAALNLHCDRHGDYLDDALARFDREVQFYVAYLDYASFFRTAGLSLCYPVVSQSKEVAASDTFDMALALKLIRAGSPVVCNDFAIENPERIVVVSGPNQGGKTTFARTFGQLHYLASLGVPVPGSHAQLFLFDALFTHFEKEENIENLRGKLQDDLIRVHGILEDATPDSIVILNEIFTSTTLADAQVLGRKIMEQIIRLDLLCVCVTFVYELASLGPTTVSMVSTVDADDPTVRTYKVVKRAGDGSSYAAAIADKYGLSYERLHRRLAS